MSRVYTYSFEDTTVEIMHPGFGRYSAYGTGIGNVKVSMAQNVTSKAVAADLTVIVSKHVYKDGTIDFSILQSSDFNNWLKKLSAFLENSNTDQWALTTISVQNKSTVDSFYCTGVVPVKRPDVTFDAKAENIDWSFEAANISNS